MAIRILLADDEPSLINMLSMALSSKGYEIDVATDGEEAYQMATSSSYDVILLDINMPKMDGLEACYLIRNNENTRDVPIAMVTALTVSNSKKRAFEHSKCNDYLIKPFSISKLIDTIEGLLTNKQQ